MDKIALTIPGESSTPTNVPIPSGIPSQLTGGLQETGSVVFQTAYNWIFLIGIFLAVVMILYSGIQMITSGGDTQKLANAKKRLFLSIAGLVIIAGAFFIVNLVIKIFFPQYNINLIENM